MEINCVFGVKWESVYTCYVNEANITEKDHVIKEFKGVHGKEESHNDVERVHFENTTVDYFPRGLEKHFPNLTRLIINGGGIKEISKNDLNGLDDLVCLFVENCELTSLPDDLLTEMPNLREVSFSGNKIEFESSEFLKPLLGRENVRQDFLVDLRKNKNIDAHYWPGRSLTLRSFEGLIKLIDEKCSERFVVPDRVDFDPNLKEMWTSGRLSDLTIIAGEKGFKVHKDILRMRSKVFAEMFEDQNEATEMKLPEFSASSVEALLKFIYMGEISKDQNEKENFEIADKFKVADMKSFYEKIIFNRLYKSNAEEIFLFAHRYSSQLLMERAIQQIANMFPGFPVELLKEPEKLKEMVEARLELCKVLDF